MISNWGNYPKVQHSEIAPGPQVSVPSDATWIARGMGRCYGDSSLGEVMVSSRRLDRMLAFDPSTGVLTCEAGVTYEDLLTTFAPRGWFPPVTPGTKFVSLGGAIASDVHGKNHHAEGSISDHVSSFDLLLPTGDIVTCSREETPDLFLATTGGMGLTGMILRVTLQLKNIETTAIKFEYIKARNLQEILSLIEEFNETTYSVAWIDTLAGGKRQGRSILMKGEHASLADVRGSAWEEEPFRLPKKPPLLVPFHFPSWVLNPLTMSAFNQLYYHKQRKRVKTGLTDYDGFFYPLDSIHHWNRIYGKKGFTQYQFVVPASHAATAISEVLSHMKKHRMGSFLSVLKMLGPSSGYLAFPMQGYTLTLDFPISKWLFPFLDELDEIVLRSEGRLYLTKDVRMKPDMLEATYPQLHKFRAVRDRVDPEKHIRSLQAERLGL